jgi:hypothetical protein
VQLPVGDAQALAKQISAGNDSVQSWHFSPDMPQAVLLVPSMHLLGVSFEQH